MQFYVGLTDSANSKANGLYYTAVKWTHSVAQYASMAESKHGPYSLSSHSECIYWIFIPPPSQNLRHSKNIS